MENLNDILLAVVRAQMLAVLFLWGKVAWHYGRAAKVEWIQQGGGFRTLWGELLHPFTWGWRQFLSKLRLMKPHEKTAYETYTPYTPGVILRFAIWAAAIAPMLAFIRLFTPPYNPPVSHVSLLLSVALFAFSLLGALAHLYVAHRQRPLRWMWIAVGTSIWFVAGPLLFYAFWPDPVPVVVGPEGSCYC